MDAEFVKDNYIRVYQDIRGMYRSEGEWILNRPISGPLNKTGIDESTDAYDTIEWLVKNTPEANGNVGVIGSSYLGFTALMTLINPHPALKAVIAQSPMVDGWMGDDWFHNGAFRISSLGFPLSQGFNKGNGGGEFALGGGDDYTRYLEAGSMADFVKMVGAESVPGIRKFLENPAYTDFWSLQAVDKWLAAKTIDPNDFVATTQRAFRLMEWQFKYRIENFEAYVSIVAELRLEPNILELIPLGSSPNTDNKYPVLVSPEKWRDMLTSCLRSKDPQVQYAMATSARLLALKEVGWTDFDANDPRKIQRRQIIDDAPDFIKHSELEDHDKVYIADAYVQGVDDAIVMEAKRIAVERLENIKKVLQHGDTDQLSQLGPILKFSAERILNDSLRDAVDADQKRSRDQVKIAERKRVEELFSHPQELADAIKQKLASTSLQEWQINNRPALDVLLSRICSLPTPELKLIAAHLIEHKELSLKGWFDSMRDEHEVERTNKQQSTLTDTK